MYDFKWWFRLGKGVATFAKISQVSYMWTSLIAVSISDWVNLDHLRISTFGWKNSNSAFFTLILFPITGICALIWYLSQSRMRYLCQNDITARVKYHLMPFIPQKFIIISLQNYKFHHYRCNPRYLSNSAKTFCQKVIEIFRNDQEFDRLRLNLKQLWIKFIVLWFNFRGHTKC